MFPTTTMAVGGVSLCFVSRPSPPPSGWPLSCLGGTIVSTRWIRWRKVFFGGLEAWVGVVAWVSGESPRSGRRLLIDFLWHPGIMGLSVWWAGGYRCAMYGSMHVGTV